MTIQDNRLKKINAAARKKANERGDKEQEELEKKAEQKKLF